jgi:iron complex transport system substrate-binding protein
MSTSTARFRRHHLGALAAACLLLPACGGPAAANSPGTTASAPAFSVVIHAANGEVRLAHRPTRIVSLSPSATEDLFAVGAGGQVVAVDSYSTYPKSAPHTKLSAYEPNVEAIAEYRPDLVVVSNDQDHIVAQLGKLRVPVLVEPAAANLAQLYGQIIQLGRATGHRAGAGKVVTRMKAQVRAIVRSTPRPKPPLTVYHELDQTYYSATSHSFVGQIYALLGLHDIADAAPGSNPYPQLSSEYVISANPDLIVLADTTCCGQSLAALRARPGWQTILAVKNGAVVAVKDEIASEWGPRVVQFMQKIADEVKTLRRAGT